MIKYYIAIDRSCEYGLAYTYETKENAQACITEMVNDNANRKGCTATYAVVKATPINGLSPIETHCTDWLYKVCYSDGTEEYMSIEEHCIKTFDHRYEASR